MTIIEWITLASSVGALGAALVALLTLQELFRQRKASYKPDLCVLQNYFEVSGTDSVGINIPLDWAVKGKEGIMFQKASVLLVNVGFGAAKNVEANWLYDSEKYISAINQMAQKIHQDFYLDNESSLLSIKSKKGAVYAVNTKMNTFNFEYLLPSDRGKRDRDLPLPPAYTLLVSLYLGLCIKSGFEFDEISLPNLNLNLKYEDIGKGKHKSTHRLSCKILHLTYPREDSGKSLEYALKIVESS